MLLRPKHHILIYHLTTTTIIAENLYEVSTRPRMYNVFGGGGGGIK